MSLTWEQFNVQVRLYLHTYNSVPEIQTLIDTLIPAGVEDLQRTIDYYQTGHSDTYTAAMLSTQVYVQLGTAPLGRIRSARMVKYDTDAAVLLPNIFRSLRQVPWSKLPAMRGGEVSAFTGVIALDPVTRAFAVSPPLNAETRLVIEWTGVKSNFTMADVTPFDERAAEAVGLYVLSKVTRVIDRDAQQAASYAQSYAQLKRQILSETRWNAVVDNDVDSQGYGDATGDDTYVDPSAPAAAMNLFDYLPDITALIGGEATDLDGIITLDTALTNTVVFIVISGIPQYWRLVLGTDPTSEVNGFIRPTDYNALTNARVWSRLT